MKRTPKSKPKKLAKRLGYGNYQQDPIDPLIFHPPKDNR